MPGRRQLPYRAVDFPPIDGGLRGSVSPHQPAGLRPLSEQTELAGIALKAAVSTLRRPARSPVRRLPEVLAGGRLLRILGSIWVCPKCTSVSGDIEAGAQAPARFVQVNAGPGGPTPAPPAIFTVGFRAPRTMTILLLEISPLWHDARFHC